MLKVVLELVIRLVWLARFPAATSARRMGIREDGKFRDDSEQLLCGCSRASRGRYEFYMHAIAAPVQRVGNRAHRCCTIMRCPNKDLQQSTYSTMQLRQAASLSRTHSPPSRPLSSGSSANFTPLSTSTHNNFSGAGSRSSQPARQRSRARLKPKRSRLGL